MWKESQELNIIIVLIRKFTIISFAIQTIHYNIVVLTLKLF